MTHCSGATIIGNIIPHAIFDAGRWGGYRFAQPTVFQERISKIPVAHLDIGPKSEELEAITRSTYRFSRDLMAFNDAGFNIVVVPPPGFGTPVASASFQIISSPSRFAFPSLSSISMHPTEIRYILFSDTRSVQCMASTRMPRFVTHTADARIICCVFPSNLLPETRPSPSRFGIPTILNARNLLCQYNQS